MASLPEQTLPDEEDLGPGFVNWLRKQFGWLFTQGQGAKGSIGMSFVYDEEANLLGEYDNGSAVGKGRTEYIWLPTESGQAIPVGLYRNGKFYAVHSDHLGTPRLITDPDRKPVWQWPYSAFGNNKTTGTLAATTGSNGQVMLKGTKAPVEVNLRFPGQYFDEESNLSYNYFRSYQAGLGRYTQPDPIGLHGGLNPFGYADATPATSTDPLGLATEMCKRKLNNVPFSFGPLYHQYVCVPDGKGGKQCGGLGPTGKMMDSPGKMEYEQSTAGSTCETVADDSDCVEQCIRAEFVKKPPNYSLDLSKGENCQSWSNGAVAFCKAQCRSKK